MSKAFQNCCAAALLWLGFTFVGAAAAQSPASPDSVFRLSVARGGAGALEMRWIIAPGNYLYRDKIAVTGDDAATLPVTTEAGEPKADPTFGQTEVYHNEARATVTAADLPPIGAVRITYQGCAEQGVCYPPQTRKVDLQTLEISAVSHDLLGTAQTSVSQVAGPKAPAADPEARADDQARGAITGRLPALLLGFFGFGLLLAFTPCVFPMIPILAGMLTGAGAKLSSGRGFVLSMSYVLAMAAAYGSLGVVAAWSGQNLQIALQTPWVIGAFSLLFVVLALSMFGLYDLQLPAVLNARLAGPRAGGGGSVAGAALLGFGSALVVGPCVTPPLAAALVYIAQTGDLTRGAAALFMLGLGMGAPLVFAGTFGSKFLPKSGRWLVTVKQAFGVVFLALAIAMSSRVLPSSITLLLWGLLGIGAGTFLGAFDRTAETSGAVHRLAKATGIASVVYGCVLLVGFAIGGADPFRPLAPLAGLRSTDAGAGPSLDVQRVTSLRQFDAAVAQARADGRPVFVDFTAEWCTTCGEMEETVFSDPSVIARLEKVSVIKADLTVVSEDSRRLMDRFDVVGPPTMLFLDPRTGREIDGSRLIGAITVPEFLARLDRNDV